MTTINHPDLPLRFVFEDDGKTGYAYLHENDKQVVADVWVYNSADTPDESEWKTRENLPFRNTKNHTNGACPFRLPTKEDDIQAIWVVDGRGREGAIVWIDGMAVAELYVGDMPGRSLMASKDGPLARVMRPTVS